MFEFLHKEKTGLLVVDVQETLFPLVDQSDQIFKNICLMIEVAKILKLPIFVTEQYPEGLKGTLPTIKEHFFENQVIYSKTSFSGYYETLLKTAFDQVAVDDWILIGIETHVCILQTAKDLVKADKRVVVLNDAVSSRSAIHHLTALEELRECGVRLSTSETVIYEMLRDAITPEFKEILSLVKSTSIDSRIG